MKIISSVILVLAGGLLLAGPAVADRDRGHRVNFDDIAERQQTRIQRGIRKGDLTRHEAHKLRKQQRRIRKQIRRFNADGWLSRYERRSIKKRYRRASENIYRLRHNDQRRHYRHRRSDHWQELRQDDDSYRYDGDYGRNW